MKQNDFAGNKLFNTKCTLFSIIIIVSDNSLHIIILYSKSVRIQFKFNTKSVGHAM